mmetsp:Transcript_32430/g.41522  ORF Transcript_32430/g.41522 Transcript_32430/m.41522 type:complete len:488 (+) Transcript_32430:288-1751(+)
MQNYDLIKMIGQGSYGDVNLVSKKNDPKLYVMKVVRNASDEEGEEAMKEVHILENLDHPNIVKLIECFHQNRGKTLCIVMEYCESGDLFQQIEKAKKKRQYISQSDILDWFVQLCLALKYLHEDKHILHRDLKPANVFLTHRARVLKLGDFGITKVLENTRAQAMTTIGTPYYFSPEICQNQPYGMKSDVWATGCIVYELMTLSVPFEAKSMAKLVQNILHQKPASPNTRYYTKEFLTLLAAMLAKGPSRRPTISQCLATPLVRSHMRGFNDRFGQFYKEEGQQGPGEGSPGGSHMDSMSQKREQLMSGRRDKGQRVMQSQAARAAPASGGSMFEMEDAGMGDNAAFPGQEGEDLAVTDATQAQAGIPSGEADEGPGLKMQMSAIEENEELEKTAIHLHSAAQRMEEHRHGVNLMSTIARELERAEEPIDEAHHDEGYDGELPAAHAEPEGHSGMKKNSATESTTSLISRQNASGAEINSSQLCSLM